MILNNKDCLGIQRVINSPKGDIDLYFQVRFNGQETVANLKEIVATFDNAFITEDDTKVNLVIKQEDATFTKFTELTDNITVFEYQPNFDEHIQVYEENLKEILNSDKVVKSAPISSLQDTPPSDDVNKDEISTQNDELVTTFIQDIIIALNCTDPEEIYKLVTDDTIAPIDKDETQPTQNTSPEVEPVTETPPTPEAAKVTETIPTPEVEKAKVISEPSAEIISEPSAKIISEPEPQLSEANWIDKLEINEVFYSPIYENNKTIETTNLIIEMNMGSLNIRTKR